MTENVLIVPSIDDDDPEYDGFVAISLDHPGCNAWGVTEERARAELDSAIEAWIESHQAAGNTVLSA
jgi:predicted RNase H-like HicB family nuclease